MESDGITMPKCANVCPEMIKFMKMTDRNRAPFFMNTLLCPKKNHKVTISS
jgi:hypothetical protein